MKFMKNIGLFVVYPFFMMTFGFFVGLASYRFFYSGYGYGNGKNIVAESGERSYVIVEKEEEPADSVADRTGKNEVETEEPEKGNPGVPKEESRKEESGKEESEEEGGTVAETAVEAAANSEKVSADTDYCIIEMDLKEGTSEESVIKLPHKYIGMDREQFLAAMENYDASPPLSERERGFVGIEVLSFSRDKIVVQKNYSFEEKVEGYYLAVYNNEVVAYLEDKNTVYMNTGIKLEALPESLQKQIIDMLWIPDDETLFGFLEAYSS